MTSKLLGKVRNKEERLTVIMNLTNKLKEFFNLSLRDVDCDALTELKKIFSDYVNQDDTNPKRLCSFSGKIPFPEFEKNIHYCLPIKKMNEPYIILKNDH